ncbi:peptidyl-prolyl cis-trans isomerase [Gemmobacter serpentinus]|uniref:peptidyl-prolyl cis-trans isomerase n=1 Tax=Gemmobacter serpentinus TaxID=2652247 RepID=UPI00124E6A41|nr:peptidyl-prolyl cis-trans isomerase [Gemmobacter serpentinus]
MTKDSDTDSPKRKRRGGSFLAWALLAMVVTGFGGYGITSFGTASLSIGTVGNRDIDANRYARALQNQITTFGQQMGTPLTLEQAQQFGIDAQVRQNLVTNYALDNEADRIGLSVGDLAVAHEIRAMDAFKGVSGQFDARGYEEALRRNNMTVREYETGVREDIARSLLTGAVASGFVAPETLTTTIQSYIAERRGLSVLTLTESALTAPLPAADDAVLQAYYEANVAAFTKPEAKRITYVALLPEDLAKTMPVDEDELHALYEARADQYRQPERRLVERLVFGSDAEAEAAKARLDAGEAFDTLVAERGLKLIDVDMGDVTRAELGAAADGVFALTEPGIAGPLPSDLGPALYRINAVLAAQETSFEDARADLATEYQQDAARREIADKTEAVDDALAGGATLEDLAKEQGMTLATLDFSAQSDEQIVGYPAFRDAAAKAAEGDFAETIQLNDGGIAALRMDQTVPATPIPFDEAKPAVTEAWHRDALHKALMARAEEIKTEVEKGTPIGQFGIVSVAREIARDGRIEATPDSLMAEAFKLPQGGVAVVESPSYVGLVQVNAVMPADSAGTDAIALKGAIAMQVEQGLAQDALSLFTAGLAQQAGITFNQANIDAVHSQMLR